MLGYKTFRGPKAIARASEKLAFNKKLVVCYHTPTKRTEAVVVSALNTYLYVDNANEYIFVTFWGPTSAEEIKAEIKMRREWLRRDEDTMSKAISRNCSKANGRTSRLGF